MKISHLVVKTIAAVCLLLASVSAFSSAAPSLVLSEKDITALQGAGGGLLGQSLAQNKRVADMALGEGIIVPWPEDAGGGYTHEQHKRNYKAMYAAGLQYQLSGDKAYSDYVVEMLIAYAEMYPKLGLHPEKKEQTPGKLFWQSLNEAVWLVYTVQAYDFIAETLSEGQNQSILNDLLYPVADYLSIGQPQTFDKIHNHGTWAVAAVGMVGYATNREDYVAQALTGLNRSGESGFYQQLDKLFSPDGYYTEGPYYQRYALLPFVWFAKAIDTNEPDENIFGYRDGILLKAIRTTIELSYNGLFIPINDAIKDKGIKTEELVQALAIAYDITSDRSLSDVARQQERVSLSAGGVALSNIIARDQVIPYPYQSKVYSDGADGDQGGLALMRSGDNETGSLVVAKNTSQGMGHGHFDRLGWQFYDNGQEVVTDYGAARYLNVEAKYGGHYLRENDTWAKQTVAHNAVVVDQASQFGADLMLANARPAEQVAFESSKVADISIGRLNTAYQGVMLTRVLALVKPELANPFVIDVVTIESDKVHQYDLPFHFSGQIIDHNLTHYKAFDTWKVMGESSGYQHMLLRSEGKSAVSNNRLTWLLDDRFYSYTFGHSVQAEVSGKTLFFQLGANDPDHNLRREQGLLRRLKSTNAVFYSVVEPHGEYNGTHEYVRDSSSKVKNLEFQASKLNSKLIVDMGEFGKYILIMTTKSSGSGPYQATVVRDINE
ncbi:heparinase II/III family protein [Gilvimarinus sp. SDUM040013]|uniref:Heparinase II/III family protein n=1 Tax=Gilvimarinus gilvus TaxID=3058038 RepID=A0ABU4S0D8_9GAMM|nr:heparinase II/III family protein [Gilvimarinus sp. SDUM040013]MDO3385909.1 heparinase II/III family protein [Gilvimarinus sp. SDUM040013]MDX6850588.1 heparinase II/III family protein [Gilvimarinus sp. SDUM040013]